MGLFNRRREAVTPEDAARRALEEAERLVATKPKAALKKLAALRGETYPLVTFGGLLHAPFVQLVTQALGWPGPIPEVRTASWNRWKSPPSVAQLLALAEETAEPVLYLFTSPSLLRGGAVAEMEALRILVDDPRLVMVVAGEMNAFFRTALLRTVAPHADPGSEEVLQEIRDAARAAGLTMRFAAG